MIWLQNIIILLGVALVAVVVRGFYRSERWQRPVARLKKDITAKICLSIISVYCFIGLLDSVVIPGDKGNTGKTLLEMLFSKVPREKSYSAPLATQNFNPRKPEPLAGQHWMGTDSLGKDTLLYSLKGCRTALIIGGLTSLILIPLGTVLGILAGYFKGWVDDVIQYLYSTISSIPHILLLIAILMVLGKGLPQMAFALSMTGWVGLCRLLRGETLRQSERPYLEAARAMGQSHWKIITRHVLPNVMPLILINFILGFSGLVMSETILSYIGVGAPIGTASWGLMIDSARMELARDPAVWWNVFSAALTLFCLVLPLNLLGDSLRRAFNPKLTS